MCAGDSEKVRKSAHAQVLLRRAPFHTSSVPEQNPLQQVSTCTIDVSNQLSQTRANGRRPTLQAFRPPADNHAMSAHRSYLTPPVRTTCPLVGELDRTDTPPDVYALRIYRGCHALGKLDPDRHGAMG